MAPAMKDISSSNEPTFPGLAVTGQWIARLVETLCGNDEHRLLSVAEERIDEDQGYCSIVAKLSLQWSNMSNMVNGLPSSVILKMPTFAKLEDIAFGKDITKDQQEKMFNTLMRHHNNECRCYSLLSTGKNLSIPHPIIYGMSELMDRNSVSYLLMEDLSQQGTCPDFVDGLTLKQCESVVESIAKLHAFCYTNPNWNRNDNGNKGNKFQNPKQIDWGAFVEVFTVNLKLLEENYPKIFTDIGTSKDELDKLFNLETIFDDLFAPKEAVLVHGDLWLNNLLFGSPTNNARETTNELVAIIDWQLVYPGYCTADLGRLFISSLDWKMRRENEENLLEHYYKCLQKKLPTHIEPPLSLQEVKQLYYKQTFRFYALFFACQAPLFLLQKKHKEKYTKEETQNFIKRIQAAIQDARSHSI